MIKEKITTKEITEKDIFCDICKVKTDKQRKCIICERDLCEKCVTYDWGMGDYYDTYCKECWDIGEPFRQQMEKQEIEYDKNVEILDNEWKRLALENISE